MTRPDAGYATVLVMGLMGSLSVMATAWLNLAAAEGRRAVALSEQIAADYAAEGAFHMALADILNQRAGAGEQTTPFPADTGDHVFTLRIDPLTDQADINRDPTEEIRDRLVAVLPRQVLATQIADSIERHRQMQDAPIRRIEDLGSGEEFDEVLPCLREALTVFHNAAPPSRPGSTSRLTDGTLIRIRVAAAGGPVQRGAEGIVLLTGNLAEPAWIMDWRRFSDLSKEECLNDI